MNLALNSNVVNGMGGARRHKFGVGALVFLLLFGAAFVLVGFFVINSLKIDSSWARTTGRIVDSRSSFSNGSTTYSAIIRYSVNGQNYQTASSFGSSFMPSIGGTKEVAYNPAQPGEAKIVEGAGATWWIWLFPAIGVVVLIVAPILFIKSLKRSSKINNLLQTGQKLQGVLTDINSSVGNNNQGGYRIVVSAADPAGVVRNYTSDLISGIGGLSMADFRAHPILIDVYIDPTNPESYYVDISDIPNLTPQRISELIKSAVVPAAAATTPNTFSASPTITPTTTSPNDTSTPQAPGPV